MKEYTIKIWNGKSWHHIPACRSCIESAKFMSIVGCILSEKLNAKVICSLFRDYEVVNAFDFERGTCCGQISIEPELVTDIEIIKLHVA